MRIMRRILVATLLTASAIALVSSTVGAQRSQPAREDGTTGLAPGRTPQAREISQRQLDRLEARIATANAIATRFEREARALGLTSDWRRATLETLLPLSFEDLRRVEQEAFNLDALANATRAVTMEPANAPRTTVTDDPSALGDLNRDLVYTPIAPCRFIDTRNAGGKIVDIRGFDVDLTGASYGGAGACNPISLLGVPFSDYIGALAINVTVFDTSTASAPGFVAVKPSAAAPTTSLLNWYEQGPTVQVANLGIVSLLQSFVQEVPNEFLVQTSGAVHIIVDIFGAFIMPQATALQTQHLFESVVVPHLAAGEIESPSCPANFTLTGGGCYTDQFGNVLSLSYPGGGDNRWACRSHNTSGVDSILFA
ncbi:MAG: hypothetical protein ACRD2A_05360, partial [Vicinamibacterales bacterium]